MKEEEKTVPKRIYYLILNLFLLPFLAILFLARIIFNIRFVRIIDNRLGHFIANTDLFLRRTRNDKAKYVAIASTKPVNRYVMNVFRRYLKIFQIPKVIYSNQVFITTSSPGSMLHKLGLYYSLPLESNEYKEFNSPNIVNLTEEEKIRGKEFLKKMNIGSWYICFHSRDKAYLSELLPNTKMSIYSFRDSDIKNYLKAAEFIASKNGYALRMGHTVAEPLKHKNPKIIDYASLYRTDFGDYYLMSGCMFYLGNTSGLTDLAHLTNVPYACANLIPLKYPPMRAIDIFIPKKIWSRNKKRFLTFREVIGSDVINFVDSRDYEKAGLETIENSSEEILELAKEMYGVLKGTYRYTNEDEALQRKFKALFPKSSHCHGFPSRIGTEFLRKNKYLLE